MMEKSLKISQYFWPIMFTDIREFREYLFSKFEVIISASRKFRNRMANWKPNQELLKLKIECCYWIFLGGLTCGIAIFSILLLLASFLSSSFEKKEPIVALIITVVIYSLLFCLDPIFKKDKKEVKDDVEIAKTFNPFSVYFYYPFRGILWPVKELKGLL